MANLSGSVADSSVVGWQLENTYARLPEVFFVPATPAQFPAPKAAILNHRLAEELGLSLDAISPEAAAPVFTGQDLLEASQPIAQAYAGHQFGSFTMLGDGRAILLGEQRTPSGELRDIQLKGAGRTRFSRGGDGLAALGPMLREYIISEAMAALGIPTTRSLAVATTGAPVYRQAVLKGAVLTRVAASHLRVGTFQYAAALRNEAHLRALADYAIGRHYPELANVSAPEKYLEFYRAALKRQASLIAQWQHVGFIHGVMNTDNMAISGETIDYGPCAFMNTYDPATVFSSIDYAGRYSYGNQPGIAQWNLVRFAEALLPLFDPEEEKAVAIATEALNEYPALFESYWLAGMRKKLGLKTEGADDVALFRSLLDWMQKSRADFTNTFRDLSSAEQPPTGERYQDPDFLAWHAQWQQRLREGNQSNASAAALVQSANPAVIPRNHRVEEALAAAEEHDDLSPLHRLLDVLEKPYDPGADSSPYREPSPDHCGYQTFCGT